MLKIRKCVILVCIEIFLEKSLTSEEIETNGGWGIVNEQTMFVKSKSNFRGSVFHAIFKIMPESLIKGIEKDYKFSNFSILKSEKKNLHRDMICKAEPPSRVL